MISDRTHTLLEEILDFRHFRRYYYHVEFDWDRIDHLINKINHVHPMVKHDFARFLDFLQQLQ